MNERIFLAAQALLNDIEAMQAGEADSEKDWFEGFSTWEYDSKPDGSEYGEDDTVAIEWPNLALSAGRLKAAIREVLDLMSIQQEVEIASITAKMVGKIPTEPKT